MLKNVMNSGVTMEGIVPHALRPALSPGKHWVRQHQNPSGTGKKTFIRVEMSEC